MTKKALFLSGLFGMGLVFPAPEAHAYLDPGTGSFLVQMLVGGLAAGAAGAAMYWNRLKAMVFGNGSTERTGRDGDTDRETPDRNG